MQQSRIWFSGSSRARSSSAPMRSALKLCFLQHTPQAHAQAPEQKSRFHFVQIDDTVAGTHEVLLSTEWYAFCLRGSVGFARAAIVLGPVPKIQENSAPHESPKKNWFHIFGSPGSCQNHDFEAKTNVFSLQRPPGDRRSHLLSKAVLAIDRHDNC